MIWSQLPSTDLYFLNSCKKLIATSRLRQRPVLRIGSNTFKCGNRYLIIRSDKEKVLSKILSTKDIEIFYLIDDNIWDASTDLNLPQKYRSKLAKLSSGILREVIRKSRYFIVSSNTLTKFLPTTTPTFTLSPCWHSTPPGAEHFQQNIIKIVHLGTNSHQAGFQFLQPVLEYVLEKTPNVSFTYYSNIPLLGSLDKHPKVIRRKIMRWKRYKNQIGNELFHLGLYPMLETPFNLGRSHNKILEFTLTGCAAIFSSNWNHCGCINHGKNGWLCENDPQSWVSTILSLVKEPAQMLAGFRGTTQLFYQLNDLKSQRAFWKHLLLED